MLHLGVEEGGEEGEGGGGRSVPKCILDVSQQDDAARQLLLREAAQWRVPRIACSTRGVISSFLNNIGFGFAFVTTGHAQGILASWTNHCKHTV